MFIVYLYYYKKDNLDNDKNVVFLYVYFNFFKVFICNKFKYNRLLVDKFYRILMILVFC